MSNCTPGRATTRLWTCQQRAFCVELYLKKTSFLKIHETYRQQFGTDNPPSRSAIFKWVRKFRSEGTVKNLYKQYDGRHTPCGRPTIRTPEVIAIIRKSVEQSPRRSSRKRSQSFGNVCKISRTTMLSAETRSRHVSLQDTDMPQAYSS